MVETDDCECVWVVWGVALCVQWRGERDDRYVEMLASVMIVISLTRSEQIAPDSPLAELLTAALPLPPTPRSHLLETSPTLAAAHAAAAATGDTATPALEDEVDIHFVCFVKGSDGHLWELDGARKGPLDRGRLEDGEDVLSENGLEKGVRRFLRREEEEGKGEGRFSLLALGPAMD